MFQILILYIDAFGKDLQVQSVPQLFIIAKSKKILRFFQVKNNETYS